MPYRTDARLSGRHPFEIFMLVLASLTSLPTVLGRAAKPPSITEALPPLAQFLWALILCLGSTGALVGIWWHNRATGLVVEQLGLALVGITSLIYVVVALFVTGLSIPIGIVFGFGASCLKRWWDLQGVINEVSAEGDAQSNGDA